MKTLKFNYENAKLKGIWHFSLPSGFTCPGAFNCKTFADRVTGKIRDAQTPDADGIFYRCYAAMYEARRPNVRANRWHNFDLLQDAKSVADKVKLIADSIPEALKRVGGILRVHIGGDFFNYNYFKAWMKVATMFPRIRFYAYTKSVKLLSQFINEYNGLPSNFVFTCSKGGKYDNLIPATNVKSAKVFFNQAEIDALGLDTDHTDELAIFGTGDFALLIHGSQPAGSTASKALTANKKKGFKGYADTHAPISKSLD